MENRLSENNMQKGVKVPLNTKFRYKGQALRTSEIIQLAFSLKVAPHEAVPSWVQKNYKLKP